MNDMAENINGSEAALKEKSCITDCCVGGDYDVSLKMYSDKNDKTPTCTHHMRGTGKHSVCKLICVGGAVAVGAALLVCGTHIFCSWVCKSK